MPIKLFSRLLGSAPDPREALRPLWHRVVEIAREKRWYAELGAADTVAGRFDMITAVLALVLLRLERDPELSASSAYLTELFVEDMDGQLRESGVGDLVVGKHIGRLMAAMGGRLGAFRDGLSAGGPEALSGAVERNVSLLKGHSARPLAEALYGLHKGLEETPGEAVLAGEI